MEFPSERASPPSAQRLLKSYPFVNLYGHHIVLDDLPNAPVEDSYNSFDSKG
jgi:hypothetical protein